jgi:hypothetical protein
LLKSWEVVNKPWTLTIAPASLVNGPLMTALAPVTWTVRVPWLSTEPLMVLPPTSRVRTFVRVPPRVSVVCTSDRPVTALERSPAKVAVVPARASVPGPSTVPLCWKVPPDTMKVPPVSTVISPLLVSAWSLTTPRWTRSIVPSLLSVPPGLLKIALTACREPWLSRLALISGIALSVPPRPSRPSGALTSVPSVTINAVRVPATVCSRIRPSLVKPLATVSVASGGTTRVASGPLTSGRPAWLSRVVPPARNVPASLSTPTSSVLELTLTELAFRKVPAPPRVTLLRVRTPSPLTLKRASIREGVESAADPDPMARRPEERSKAAWLVRLRTESKLPVACVTVMPANGMTASSWAPGTRPPAQLPASSQSPLTGFSQVTVEGRNRLSSASNSGRQQRGRGARWNT